MKAEIFYVDKKIIRKKRAFEMVNEEKKEKDFKVYFRIDHNSTTSDSWIFDHAEYLNKEFPLIMRQLRLDMLNLKNKHYWIFLLYSIPSFFEIALENNGTIKKIWL